MLRRRFIALLVACLTLTGAAGTQAAPELSVSDRLQDRRYLASSERAYSVGFEVRRPTLRETNRGLEVLAEVPGGGRGRHVLMVVAD